MRRLILSMLLISPAASALDITGVTYSNIREGTIAGRVTAEMTFTVSYRNLRDTQSPTSRLRVNCRTVHATAWLTGVDLANSNFFTRFSYPVSSTGGEHVTLNEVYSAIRPATETYTKTIENAIPNEDITFNVKIGINTGTNVCLSYDWTRVPGPGNALPVCNINVQSDMAHGALSLPVVGNSHTANGVVQVTCSTPADVTVSTGHAGSLRINDTLSTDISVDGSPNSATKTVNGTELFTVSSRLYRTSASNWGGSFSQPVVMTISWP